ncbi:two-component system sensor histidine kinase EvgS [Pseudomonas citronellolis]|uniref:response regulator n=1 Tax=Pseudomonas citronellolis TaxID=53408 RepID=UPI00209ECA6E|nr:response regulator [Pseudomonas citronellolis]MCP1646105.1 two-component system sensor histidine kinase EvgS [Pseudomonas citronellolis]MCP1669087.1 two-component system sensor histidine kinase EvgS [Pseudomonas citronellolis]MCP1700511.1 two-component system sensor histidine kinase EvgS [Pseudomonas citronellolis]MCP1706897.1 two-component system sensor histidine kinase EvgS [Pseudomonas citronellolis]MCP1800680.1 two-component system sensor histidine kinase EvgS [Pseudomonas citronellolis
MSRIIIIDNHPITCVGTRALLEGAGHAVVGVADNGVEGLDLCRRLAPELVVLDLKVPRLGGLDVIRRIRARQEGTQVLVFTDLPADVYEHACVECGAAGFVAKSDTRAPLLDAVAAVLAGRTFFKVGALRPEPIGTSARGTAQAEVLTPREITVLHYLADGYRVKDIAAELAISDRTVSTYKARLLEKTNTSSLVELIQVAAQHGLVERPGDAPAQAGALPSFDSLIDRVPYPVSLRNGEGRVLAANAAFLRLTGLSHDQVAGSTISELGVVDAEHLEYVRKTFQAAVQARIPYMTVCVVHINGVRHVFKQGGIPVSGEDGEFIGMLCSAVDIGEQDQEIQMLRDSLEQVRSIRTRRGRYLVDFGEQALRELAALQQPGQDDALAQGLARLRGDIELLTDLARLELGQMTPMPSRADLDALTEQALATPAAPACRLQKAGTQPCAWVDTQRYRQLVGALLLYAQSLGATQVDLAAKAIEVSGARLQWRLSLRAGALPACAPPFIAALVLAETLASLLGGSLQVHEQNGAELHVELHLELPRSARQP